MWYTLLVQDRIISPIFICVAQLWERRALGPRETLVFKSGVEAAAGEKGGNWQS